MIRKLLVSALACSLVSAPVAMAAELDTLEKKASYLMGLDVGARMQALGYALDADAMRLGMQESAKKEGRAMSDEDLRNAVAEIQQRFQMRQQEAATAQAEANKKLGDEFLSENAKKEGVVTTESGLQYKIISAGDGPKPQATDSVQVHYRGTLVDGTEFDSSYSHGGPVTFTLNQVIPGWTEGLQMINQGSKAELYVPSELAYGSTGNPSIQPNSTLIFEIELLDINPQKKMAEESKTAETK